jgi:hypothetical protein
VGYFYGDGASTIGASTFSKNRTSGETGTIYFSESAGSLFVSRSTFSGNVAGTDGAGFSARNGDVKMVNVTIANNRARGFGGGLWASTPTTLNSVTIVRNVSDFDQAGSEVGGGIYLNPGFSIPVKVRNTIVAVNRLGNGTRSDCAGDPFTSLGHNLLSTRGPARVRRLRRAQRPGEPPPPPRRSEAERRSDEDGRAPRRQPCDRARIPVRRLRETSAASCATTRTSELSSAASAALPQVKRPVRMW